MSRDCDARLRRMYPGGRADAAARRLARFWAVVFRLGLQPRRWVTLEVPGRSTGRPRRFPLGMADVDGRWFLVSMLGECHWVANVRAAGGEASLLRGRRWPVHLVEVPPAERAPVVSRYLERVPGGRPHIRARLAEPRATLKSVAAALPVFRVERR